MSSQSLTKVLSIGLVNLAILASGNPYVFAQTLDNASEREFSLVAEGRVYLNSGADFEGDVTDYSDDARIYAADGFTMNDLANVFLPTQKDNGGNVLTDSNNLKILVDNAVVVHSSNPQINTPNNLYSNLDTPPQIAAQTLEVPSHENLRSAELIRRGGTATAITFNSGANPINSVADWSNYFPAPGTVSEPTVVNVSGGLTIPDGVALTNYIITVSGTVNFNGVSTFDNVMLVAEGGGINLGATQFSNSAIFASGDINMNSSARFSGASVISSTASINFDGATTTIDEQDELMVVAEGSIMYNASLDSRASLLSAGNVNFNGNTELYGFIGARADIVCNSFCGVVGVSDVLVSSNPPTEPPIILFAD